jgi:hypothetical protein
MPAPRQRIVLELDPQDDPITGRVVADPAPPRDFSGWVALTEAIEKARGTLRDAPRDEATVRPS